MGFLALRAGPTGRRRGFEVLEERFLLAVREWVPRPRGHMNRAVTNLAPNMGPDGAVVVVIGVTTWSFRNYTFYLQFFDFLESKLRLDGLPDAEA